MNKIKYGNNPSKLQSELRELNKIQFIDENLHQIKNEVLQDYTGEFAMVGSLKVVDPIRQTHIRSRNITEYEAYITSIDEGYDAEDSIFSGYNYKFNTHQFILVIRSQYGNGCDFKHETIEHRVNKCFIPTKGFCFVKCINFLTGEVYKQEYLNFIRNEKRKSNIMTKARIHPFCRANNFNLRYFDGTRGFARSVTDRDNASFLYNNYFCLIWILEGVILNQAIK